MRGSWAAERSDIRHAVPVKETAVGTADTVLRRCLWPLSKCLKGSSADNPFDFRPLHRSRLCENSAFQKLLRIIFYVVHSQRMLKTLPFFVSPKSRLKFYFSKERPSFRTA